MNRNISSARRNTSYRYTFYFILFISVIVFFQIRSQYNKKKYITLKSTGWIQKYGLRKQMILLDCIADGYPKPLITWFHNDEKVNASNRNKIQLFNGSLEIADIAYDDKGTYKCEAKNNFMSKEIVYYLSIHTPKLDKNLDSYHLNIEEGNQRIIQINKKLFDVVVFDCTATGKMKPEITWYHNDTPTGHLYDDIDDLENAVTDKNKFIMSNGSLIMVELTFDDSGIYECEAINTYGVQSIQYNLTVKPMKIKYKWISPKSYIAQDRMVTLNFDPSIFSYDKFVGRVTIGPGFHHPATASFNEKIAYYYADQRKTNNYEILQVYGKYEWKEVINRTVPFGAVHIDNSYSFIGIYNSEKYLEKIFANKKTNEIFGYSDNLKVLVVN